jgi:hypothetical protein
MSLRLYQILSHGWRSMMDDDRSWSEAAARLRQSIAESRRVRRSVVDDMIEAVLGGGVDHKELESIALELISDDDPVLQYSGAQALGHLARLYRDLDLDVVLPVLEAASSRPVVKAAAGDALDDINTFMPRRDT